MSVIPIKTNANGASKLRELLEAMKNELPVQIEILAVVAKIRREKFKAYKREGFTDAQALELVKAEIR